MNEIHRINENYFSIKISIIGDVGSGKSTLVKRWIDNQFLDQINKTIGVEYATKEFNVCRNIPLKLNIWDFGGTERLRNFNQIYFRGSYAFILCVDLSKDNAFDRIDAWIRDAKHATHDSVPIVIVGTKRDLITNYKTENKMKILEKKTQDENCVGYYITSAKQNDAADIEEIFKKIVHGCEPDIKKILDEDKPKQRENSIWRKHKRKIIAGIMVAVFMMAAIILSLIFPIAPLLASINLIISFTGSASMLAVAGMSAAIGLVVGTLISGIVFGVEKIVKKLFFRKNPSVKLEVTRDSFINQRPKETNTNLISDSIQNNISIKSAEIVSKQIGVSSNVQRKAIPLTKTLEIAKKFGEKIISGELNTPQAGEIYHADLIALVSQFKNPGIYKDQAEPVSNTNYNKTDLINDFIFFIAPYLTDRQLYEFTSTLFKLELSTAAEGGSFRNATLAKSFIVYETARSLQKIPEDVLADKNKLCNYFPPNLEAHFHKDWEEIVSIPTIAIPLRENDFEQANLNLREFISFNMIKSIVQDGFDHRQLLMEILLKERSTVDVIAHIEHYNPAPYLESLSNQNTVHDLAQFRKEIVSLGKIEENISKAPDRKQLHSSVKSIIACSSKTSIFSNQKEDAQLKVEHKVKNTYRH